MADMETNQKARSTTGDRVILGVLIAVVLVIGGLWGFSAVQDSREEAEQVDGYYCTLSGVGPMDVAPETGKTCAEILVNG